jgi:hypothetical protein
MVALAERQHGVVTRGQLLELGFGRRSIDVRLQSGRLHRLHRGVYALGRPRIPVEGIRLAAVLALGEGVVLSHRSAAAHLGLLEDSRRFEDVTVPRKLHPRTGIRVHVASLSGDERTVVDGVPVTTAARTLLDLAATEPRHRTERAFTEAEYQGLRDGTSLTQLLHRYAGHRGAAVARHLIGAPPRGITRSELEGRFLALLDEVGLPSPERNAHIEVGARLLEVDCLWREQGLIAELDGRAAHGGWRRAEADRARDRRNLAAGYRTIRVTWRQLHEERSELVADLGRLLTAR